MFEEKTYETILERMLADVPNSLDKREGSVIWDALSPTAIEHQLLYIDIDTFLREVFADTATRKYLVQRAAERGLAPKEAEPAVWRVIVEPLGMEIPMDTRFSCDDQNLYISAKIDTGVYYATCETAGTVGNGLTEELTPILHIPGLISVTLDELVQAGTDEESTEDFRTRYLTFIRRPASSGNIHDYYNWAMAVDGVGAAKVFPTWDGPGTVKVTITDANKRAAGELLVSKVKDHIEEERPVGATVTVASGTELPIHVTARIVMASGHVQSTVQNAFRESLKAFLESTAFEIDYLPVARVGDILFNTDGVEDYSDLRVNDDTVNIDLSAEQIAVIGSVVLEVAG